LGIKRMDSCVVCIGSPIVWLGAEVQDDVMGWTCCWDDCEKKCVQNSTGLSYWKIKMELEE
jgi:hypothetical protein